MGFGLPAAIGAKAAHPDALVVDIDGDGSLLMNIQEMATCYCEKLPVKVLLLNNMHLGMVVQWEDRFHAAEPRPHLSRPDRPSRGHRPGQRHHARGALSRLRRPSPRASSGAPGTCREKAELTDALQEMIDSPGPYLLDVQVPYQEHVLPMIPSGMTVRDLIKE